MDILILINSFEGDLPASYNDFKSLVTELFPVIHDTKHISYNLRRKVPEAKQWDYTDLKFLFEYFKNGTGRHLAMHSPPIEIKSENDNYFDKYHEAGWDSFCAGYIFIRLAFLKIHENHPKTKVFMPVELLNGVEEYKNCLNVIRGSINHINLGGEDPETTRPPWLVIETKRNQKLDFKELSAALCAYGNVEVKPVSLRRNKALIAVENYGSAKSWLRDHFPYPTDFKFKFPYCNQFYYVCLRIFFGFRENTSLCSLKEYQFDEFHRNDIYSFLPDETNFLKEICPANCKCTFAFEI
ncbi:hypothetical protein HHI36_008245 [Cryptolaemus montrouzieri]|uniref:Uncharacterized protein n=1 Tax=Cryptolaemus montrouzieri TaxID=559131 RepID=A0ABD2MS71_9CUCU